MLTSYQVAHDLPLKSCVELARHHSHSLALQHIVRPKLGMSKRAAPDAAVCSHAKAPRPLPERFVTRRGIDGKCVLLHSSLDIRVALKLMPSTAKLAQAKKTIAVEADWQT
jgi:hypothetical protein